jgi:sulfhydrogenase subunit delta
MGKKLGVGIFSFTGDEGCVIVFTEILNDHYKEWINLIDFKFARALQKKNTLKGMDVAFVEGAISSKREEKRVKEVRKNCKVLVAIGSCAIDGSPSNHRNFFDKERMEEITPILKHFDLNKRVEPLKKFVKVDGEVPGCPMNDKAFVEVVNKALKDFGITKGGKA